MMSVRVIVVYDMLQVKALFWIPLIQGQTDEERLQIAKETLKKITGEADIFQVYLTNNIVELEVKPKYLVEEE